MVTIVAKFTVQQGKKEEFKALTQDLIKESRNEKGCISYNLYEEMNNPNIFTFIEKWMNEEAIKLHNESKHFTTIVPKLVELQETEPEIHLYTVLY